ncbi:hypothetical protein BDV11DRAFT_195595 [Aspergillus similis]
MPNVVNHATGGERIILFAIVTTRALYCTLREKRSARRCTILEVSRGRADSVLWRDDGHLGNAAEPGGRSKMD